MTKRRTLPILFLSFLLLSALVTRAQVITNRAALQKASEIRATQESEIRRIVLARAKEKGWPLTLRNKKGRLAYLRAVNDRGFPVYITTTDNIISAATIRTNQLWNGGSTGLNLSGSASNMTGKIAVWDEGKVRSTHVELTGRINQVDNSATLSDHSTHVAGTMIAAGVNPVAKGMSYGTHQLLAYDFDNDQSEMMSAAANGLLISNHSYAIIAGWYYNSGQSRWEWYGDPGDSVDVSFGLYDADTQGWDSIAYNAPHYLITKASGNNRTENGPAVGQSYYRMNASHVWTKTTRGAAGTSTGVSNNDGYEIIATYGGAKNILTIGAVNPIPGGYTQPSDVVLADFSSWGPSGDGRIKPDLVADGINVLSSISTADNAYDIFSGTSMATPAAAGSAFLLQELYSRLHGGAANFMRAATLKGLLIHTADEAGLYPGPDYKFGWGLINMQKAASVITSDTSAARDQMIVENSLDNTTHGADSITVVASGKQPLTATISWTDPAGTPATNITANFQDTVRKLVNDLDIRITDLAGGNTYLPWILDPKNRPAAATTGDNIRDNVEKIEVDSLIPGKSYKIKVSHKGTLARSGQAYSLLVSGVGGTAYCTSASTGATGTYISNVTVGGINNTSSTGCKTYSDFTASTAASLPIGQSVPISISFISCGATTGTNIAVYIDFNNNGVFTDAGELALQSTVVLNSPASGSTAATFTGNITAPATVTAGSASRMRIVARDNGTLITPLSCGTYTAGETQDYRVVFTAPSNDVGIAALEYPTLTSCASDSQIVTIRIRNYGNTPQNSVPVTTVIKNGAATVATLSAVCKDTIPGKTDVLFTYNTTFPATSGTTYTFTSTTALAADLNTGNDQNSTSVTISTSTSTASGTATICGTNATTATLKATTSGNDLPLWYDTQTATTPIAAGESTTTTVIPSNKTYYLGLNDLSTKLGPPNKNAAYTGGAGTYFRRGGNFIQLTTSVPLTLESARMYIAHNGQITFTLATLASRSGNSYSYFPLYTTTVDVYATKVVPVDTVQFNVAAGDNTDTGGIFNLNIPIPTPGDYIIIIDCSDHTSAFINFFSSSSSSTVPYPISIPGVASITGNNFYDAGKADSLTYYKKFYFPFYNLGIRLPGCPGGARTAVVATTAPSPVITLNGNVLTSSVATGNQWYRSGILLPGATGQTDTAIYSGTYTTVVTDQTTGCSLTSNGINFVSTGTTDPTGASIGLKVSPNPNDGVFQLEFYMSTQDNTGISLLNTLGQKVYESDYPNFVGQFSQQINAGNLADGMYVLKIVHGNNTYIRKILVKK